MYLEILSFIEAHWCVIISAWMASAIITIYANHHSIDDELNWYVPIQNFLDDFLDSIPGGMDRKIARAKRDVPDASNWWIYPSFVMDGSKDVSVKWNGAELHRSGQWEEYVRSAYKSPRRFWTEQVCAVLYAPLAIVPIILFYSAIGLVVLLHALSSRPR